MNLRRKEGHKIKQSTKHNEMCLFYFLPLLFWNIETHVCVIMKNNDIKMSGAASGLTRCFQITIASVVATATTATAVLLLVNDVDCFVSCEILNVCIVQWPGTWDATKQYKILNCTCFAGNKIICYLFIACKVIEK